MGYKRFPELRTFFRFLPRVNKAKLSLPWMRVSYSWDSKKNNVYYSFSECQRKVIYWRIIFQAERWLTKTFLNRDLSSVLFYTKPSHLLWYIYIYTHSPCQVRIYPEKFILSFIGERFFLCFKPVKVQFNYFLKSLIF